jgi:hypothetical protein
MPTPNKGQEGLGPSGVHGAGRGGFPPFLPLPRNHAGVEILPTIANLFTISAGSRGGAERFLQVRVLRVLQI